jgi:glycosyltransferase involved in cell wall biosynthesis
MSRFPPSFIPIIPNPPRMHAGPPWALGDVGFPSSRSGATVLGAESPFETAGFRIHSPATASRSPAEQPAALAGADTRVTTSVLVNTHNHAAFVEDCIDSLLVQSVQPDEIIVYDDASTDETVARLRSYGSRIIVIEGEAGAPAPGHARQAHAVLTAFQRSRGDLLFLLDGDDRFKRDKIERYRQAFTANADASLIQAPMAKIDEHGRMIGVSLEPRKHVPEPLTAIYRAQDVDFFYPTSALAFSRTFLTAALPLDFSDGLELWLDTRLSMIAPYFGRVITLSDVFTDWRRHTGSHSVRIRSRRLQLAQTLMRARVFNRFCRQHGLPTISAWRNPRFYLQLLRFTLPESAYRLFERRWRRGPTAPC